ncbi:hypothetical protein RE628_18725 [Paenibacillus sp. D2_2]|uniref:hypothetical protein n=1 Tax=Paenibacillus sp. D2_2 TaxID=3073092 RepID=UPI00281628A0|nr:hypothetical protein [Paenibacillus sp. D2_2]WMT39449.1 hypothetical protein RE628_18725 [Paenibacillus sp. D2_2]
MNRRLWTGRRFSDLSQIVHSSLPAGSGHNCALERGRSLELFLRRYDLYDQEGTHAAAITTDENDSRSGRGLEQPIRSPQVQRQISIQTVRMAAIMISTVPILAVYPFLQRYFVTGFMVGSLKG